MLWKKLNKQKCKDSQSNKSGGPISKQLKHEQIVPQKDHNLMNKAHQQGKGKKSKIDFYQKCINQIDAVYEEISPTFPINAKPNNGKIGIKNENQSKQNSQIDEQKKEINKRKSSEKDKQLQEDLHVIEYMKVNQKTSKFIDEKQQQNFRQTAYNKSNDNKQQINEKSHKNFGNNNFASLSLGKVKISKKQPQQKNSTSEKSKNESSKKDEQPLIMYSKTEVDQSQLKMNGDRQHALLKAQNADTNEMEDFFQQMRQAGIDISDLQSNARSRQQSIQFGEAHPNQKSKINPNQNEAFNNNLSFRMKNLSFEKVNNSMQQMKQISDISCIKKQVNEQKTRNFQLRRLLSTIIDEKDTILVKKKQITNVLQLFSSQLFETTNLIIKKINQHEKNSSIKLEHAKYVEKLKFTILELQAEILNKQVEISKQRQKLQELQVKNQQLSQSYFDANQKLAQMEIEMKSQIQQIIGTYEEKNIFKGREQIEIQRLNQEVEQLTRLYENSQNQYRTSIQQQKITLTMQLQKIARLETNLFQREAKIEQKQFIIKQEEKRLKVQESELNKRQEQINHIQRTLSDKLSKVQELESELNEGFAYLEEVKKDNQQQAESIDREKDQLIKELQKCQQRIKYLEKWQANLNQRELQIQANKYSYAQNGFYRNSNSKQFVKSKAGVDQLRKFFTQANQDHISNLDLKNLQKNGYPQRSRFNQVSHTDRVPYQSTNNLIQGHRNYLNVEKDRTKRYDGKINPYQQDFFGKIEQRSGSGSGEKYSQYYLDRMIKSVRQGNSRQLSPNSKNLKVFSQAISSSSANPLPSSSLIKKSIMQSRQGRPIKLKYQIRQKSPTSSIKKTYFNSKLNQLDNKIQVLRKQIKKQIHAAREN